MLINALILLFYQIIKKGIFKKTALIATKILKEKLIYNSPNKKSAPAYLKCGWKKIINSNLTKINLTCFMLKVLQQLNGVLRTVLEI